MLLSAAAPSLPPVICYGVQRLSLFSAPNFATRRRHAPAVMRLASFHAESPAILESWTATTTTLAPHAANGSGYSSGIAPRDGLWRRTVPRCNQRPDVGHAPHLVGGTPTSSSQRIRVAPSTSGPTPHWGETIRRNQPHRRREHRIFGLARGSFREYSRAKSPEKRREGSSEQGPNHSWHWPSWRALAVPTTRRHSVAMARSRFCRFCRGSVKGS
jgi:hypothetical protein